MPVGIWDLIPLSFRPAVPLQAQAPGAKGAVLRCLVANHATTSEPCQAEISRFVRLALWDYARGAPLTGAPVGHAPLLLFFASVFRLALWDYASSAPQVWERDIACSGVRSLSAFCPKASAALWIGQSLCETIYRIAHPPLPAAPAEACDADVQRACPPQLGQTPGLGQQRSMFTIGAVGRCLSRQVRCCARFARCAVCDLQQRRALRLHGEPLLLGLWGLHARGRQALE